MNSIPLSSGESQSDSDAEYYSMDSDEDSTSSLIVSDAIHSQKSVNISKQLNNTDILMINQFLDINEKVSLIYLLYDSPYTALQKIILLLQNDNVDIFDDWCKYEKEQNRNWEKKLLEALSVIQNYEIIRKLGLKKEEMIITFQPINEISLHINLIRKCLYRVCENFDITNTKRFLNMIEEDFNTKNLKYIPSYNTRYNDEYLEMYLLYLETEKYISLNNIQNLISIFKRMDMDNLHDSLQVLNDKLTEGLNYNIDKTPGQEISDIASSGKFSIENNVKFVDNVYPIDPNCPGVLLIINNEYFYTEYRSELVGKLPPTELQLEQRTGSKIDEKRLIETFTRLGFTIITETNQTHESMLEIINKIVKDFNYSSLFIAILTHGDEGVVYGANSIPIEVTKIQEIICQKKLRGIPKVLLLQSCQGRECQRIDDDLAVDGPVPKKYVPPKTTDLLTFRATISGYGAVRHKKDGTWFIQTLCEVMHEFPNDHIQEICTKVIAVVTGKVWNKNCMVPIVESTFSKCLYYKVK